MQHFRLMEKIHLLRGDGLVRNFEGEEDYRDSAQLRLGEFELVIYRTDKNKWIAAFREFGPDKSSWDKIFEADSRDDLIETMLDPFDSSLLTMATRARERN